MEIAVDAETARAARIAALLELAEARRKDSAAADDLSDIQ